MIRVEKRGTFSILEIDRPPVNVLSMDLLRELRVEVRRAAGSGVRGVLLRGSGKGFSAGTDVAEHLPGKVEEMIPLFTQTVLDLLALEIPTTVYVHGFALGGGFELTLGCDFVIAHPDARFGLPEIQLGCFPPVGAALLPRVTGTRQASELILGGEEISSNRAFEMGIVNQIGPSDDAEQFVERMARFPRTSSSAAKRAFGYEEARRLRIAEEIYLTELMRHPEPVEGLRAFLEKRPPAWDS